MIKTFLSLFLHVSRHQEHSLLSRHLIGGRKYVFLYSICYSNIFFLQFFIFGGLGDPYVGSRSTKASGHEHLISKKIYVQQRKKFNNQFFIYMGHIVKKVHFGSLGVPGGPLRWIQRYQSFGAGTPVLFTEKIYVQGKKITTGFSYMGHNV